MSAPRPLDRAADTLPQLRALEVNVRAVAADTRTFSGVAVPWDDVISVWGERECFARGAVVDSDQALILWRHDEPIGKVTANTDTATGWEIDAILSTTACATEAYTLLRDGVISKLSVSFVPINWTDRPDGVREYTKVTVREISLVPFPAYDNADIKSVRSAPPSTPGDTEMTADQIAALAAKAAADADRAEQISTLTREALAPMEERLRSLDSTLATLADGAPAAGPQWRSSGDFLKALTRGDADAAQFQRDFTEQSDQGDEFRRAYTGSTTADAPLRNTWLADAITLIAQQRKLTNTFSQQALPADGLTLEYLKLKANSMSVTKQATEGADLTFGKIELDSATTPIETYGGYTQLSRQIIDRSTAPVLVTSKRALDMEYARATEAKVRATYLAVIAQQIAAQTAEPTSDLALSLPLLSSVTLFDWLDTLTDAVGLFEDRGHNLTGLHVSKDIFKSLYRLEDTAGHAVMNVYGAGVNQSGSINLQGLTGNLANMPVRLLTGAAPLTASFYDPAGLTTWEQPGAPMHLQDENTLNLTGTFSVYGYLAAASQFPDAILPVKFATA